MKSDREKLRAEANAYHKEHPDVMVLFFSKGEQAAASGRAHFGAQAVWEVIRWEVNVEGGKDWKMPNNHVAFYARYFNKHHPNLNDAEGNPFFVIVEQRSKQPPHSNPGWPAEESHEPEQQDNWWDK